MGTRISKIIGKIESKMEAWLTVSKIANNIVSKVDAWVSKILCKVERKIEKEEARLQAWVRKSTNFQVIILSQDCKPNSK
jgi:hypothetical protein